MYGGVAKDEEYQKLDQTFVEATMKEFKSRDEAASYYAGKGWEFLKEKGDWQTAMKRFNQCWLLDSRNGNCFWGFGVVETMHGHNTAAVGYLERARAALPGNGEVRADLAFAYAQQAQRLQDPAEAAAAYAAAEGALDEAAQDRSTKRVPCIRAIMRRQQGKQEEACRLAAQCTDDPETLRQQLGCKAPG